MALKTKAQKKAAAAAMRARMQGPGAQPPLEVPNYVSAETLAQLFDMSPDQAHRRFGHLPGVINIGTGKCRARRRYPLDEVLREVQRL